MIFEINNEEWNIQLINKDEIKRKYIEDRQEDASFVFGLTLYPENEIWINRDMCLQQQLKTLKHELTHCYLWSYGLTNSPGYTEEMVCDIVASSSNFIERIVAEFTANLV